MPKNPLLQFSACRKLGDRTGSPPPRAAAPAPPQAPRARRPRRLRAAWLLGPALVAGVAYLDPGNVASNMTAGARFGYLLVWVVVLGNAMAWLIQYLSAKLGVIYRAEPRRALGRRFERHRAARTGCRPSSSRWRPTSRR